MAAVNFTLESAKRIAAAVRRVEGTPQNLVGERGQTGPIGSSFFAYLLGCDLSGYHWNFLKLQPVANLPGPDDPFVPLENEKPLFQIAQPIFFGEGAREINNNRANIEAGTVVRLDFLGFDVNQKPVYVFEHRNLLPDPTGLPIHDHRDNFNGGFSFSCYHPGTALPQQPWRV